MLYNPLYSCIVAYNFRNTADVHLPANLREAFYVGSCPACLGMCVCKSCLHVAPRTYSKPVYSPKQLEIMAAHTLRVVLPALKKLMGREAFTVCCARGGLFAGRFSGGQ